ncbi:hypothetical protein K3495_g1476 [Podosphaera aphanis]|nr:hypothetical protein K3495_g1476 [Podosphaera aphanis]
MRPVITSSKIKGSSTFLRKTIPTNALNVKTREKSSQSLQFDTELEPKRSKSMLPSFQTRDIGARNRVSPPSGDPSEPLKLLENQLREKLLARPPISHYDHLTPTTSQMLKCSLASHLPFIKSCSDMKIDNKGKFCLPPGHHLVYFNPQVTSDELLPDGTDDLHSPGPPFYRRLWVGGSMNFLRPLELFPKKLMLCTERITDVRVTGTPGKEKIFVDIFREISNPHLNRHELEEVRTLVFMRREKSKEIVERKAPQIKMEPDFSIIVRPTRTLLFRFSALTFNAHRIHLDSNYCRQVEGLKSMIVQGQLTAVMMLAVLSEQLWKRARIDGFIYKNIAPLYVEEEMKICIRKGSKTGDTGNWHVWIQGPDGGCAVKGTANVSWLGRRKNFNLHGDVMKENNGIIDERNF